MSKPVTVNREKSALTDQQIEILTGAVQECEENAAKYAAARSRNKKFNIVLTFTLLILSGVTASSSGLYTLFTLRLDDPEFWYKTVSSAMFVVMLLLTSLNNVLKPAVKEATHHVSASNYGNLASDIRLELAKGVDDRPEKVDEFITKSHLLQQDIGEKSIPL